MDSFYIVNLNNCQFDDLIEEWHADRACGGDALLVVQGEVLSWASSAKRFHNFPQILQCIRACTDVSPAGMPPDHAERRRAGRRAGGGRLGRRSLRVCSRSGRNGHGLSGPPRATLADGITDTTSTATVPGPLNSTATRAAGSARTSRLGNIPENLPRTSIKFFERSSH